MLCQHRLGLLHLSTGAIFREQMARKSALGERVRRYVTNGRLVPDELVVEVMAARLRRLPKANSFILDGFPRTARQAAGLDRELTTEHRALDAALYLSSRRSTLVRRLTGRRVCARCGANYHIRTMRPKRAGACDQCRGPLTTRKDDEPATIRRRLALDDRQTTPLLNYYKRQGLLYRVNGEGRIDTVFRRTLELFRKHGWQTRRGR